MEGKKNLTAGHTCVSEFFKNIEVKSNFDKDIHIKVSRDEDEAMGYFFHCTRNSHYL